jgi:glycosyltransferase involved in cell wall biosynthesis
VRADLRIANDATVLVTVARLTRRKGHLAALTALESLPERLRQKIVWLIVGPDGEGEHVEALRKAAARARLDIRFLGRLADIEVRDLYGAGDLFCLTGSWDSTGRVEGFGLVYLEAGACGLPSVATAVGGVAEAVLSDKTGLVVEPTTEAIAAGLTRLIENPDLRTKLGQAAREYARAMSWRHCAVKTYCLKGLPRSPSVVAEIMPTQSRERGDAQLNPT